MDTEDLPDPDFSLLKDGKPPSRSRPVSSSSGGGSHGPASDFRDFDDIQDMTLREICERFGGVKQCEEHLRAYKTWQEAKKTEIVNHKAMARLVSRELVQSMVVTHMDQCNRRLLNDFPETITRLIYNNCKAGDDVEVAREVVRQNVSKILTHARDKVKRALTKLNDDDGDDGFESIQELERL